MDLFAAYAGARPAMVDFYGEVTSRPHYFYGTHTRCEHEAFDADTAAGKVEVVDNVGIAPAVRLSVGDRIEVRGEMVHDPGRFPVVHWIHYDPRGIHPGGFIRFRGRVYE